MRLAIFVLLSVATPAAAAPPSFGQDDFVQGGATGTPAYRDGRCLKRPTDFVRINIACRDQREDLRTECEAEARNLGLTRREAELLCAD